MPVLVNALVPVASVLLGAGLTYWLNVRSRRHTYVEDAFNAAITAVAVADASRNYTQQVRQPDHVSESEYRELLSTLAVTAIKNHLLRAGEAREAIARVMQYEPQLKPFYEDAGSVVDHPDKIIGLLINARDRHI